MATISTVLGNYQSRNKLRQILQKHYRPLQAVLNERDPNSEELKDPNLWPQYDLKDKGKVKTRFGFTGEATGDELVWQLQFVKFIAVRLGRLKSFPEYKFPLRKCYPFPTRGSVPYWMADGSALFPLLIERLWEPQYLIDPQPMPERLRPFMVDDCGSPIGESPDEAFENTFAPLMEKELKRLYSMLRR